MSYHHFTTFERGRIQELLELGYSHRQIGDKLNRHHASISREVKRYREISKASYQCEIAQEGYVQRRKNSVFKGKHTAELLQIIKDRLLATWSPEQIANTITKGVVSVKTIYHWIYRGILPDVSVTNLRHKGKRKKAEKRGKFSMGVSIAKRPKEVRNRATFGHWELDSMVSSRGDSKGCFATFVERKSRLYTAFKTPDRTAKSMENAITQLFCSLPIGAFKTGTTDRGKEFACWKNIKLALGLPLYFADAYSSWQRGSNENSNGLLREFFPKKTDLALIDQQELTKALFLINSRPRKCLSWKSPIEVFLHELSHLT